MKICDFGVHPIKNMGQISRYSDFAFFHLLFWNQSANANQIAGNNHWMTDFPLCDIDADRIFNMVAIEGHTFARDPMKNIIALFGNGLIEYCNIKPSQRYRLLWASSFFSLTFYRFNTCLPYQYFSNNNQKIMVFALWIGFLNGLELFFKLFFIININIYLCLNCSLE